MSEKTESTSNPLDMMKWLVIFALLAGLIAANHMYGDVSVLVRALVAVAVVVVAGFIAATTVKGGAGSRCAPGLDWAHGGFVR